MFAATRCQTTNWVSRRAATATIITATIFGSLFCISSFAADPVGGMPMGSMEMHKSMMSGMKGMESMKGSGDIDHEFAMMMKMHHQSALDMANIQLQQP